MKNILKKKKCVENKKYAAWKEQQIRHYRRKKKSVYLKK